MKKKEDRKTNRNNTLFVLSFIVHEKRTYLPFSFLLALTAFSGPLSTVLVPKLIMDALSQSMDNTFNLTQPLILVSISIVVNLIRIIIKAFFQRVYAPKAQIDLCRKMDERILEKAHEIDLSNYDDPKFYDQYHRAIHNVDQSLKTFLDATTNLLDRIIYLSTVITIISTLDPILIGFGLISVACLFLFSKITTKYRYTTEQKLTPFNRQIEFVKRIHSSALYASEIRVYPIEKMIAKVYNDANNNKTEVIVKRRGKEGRLEVYGDTINVLILSGCTSIYLMYQIAAGNLSVSSFVVLFLATSQLCNELFFFINNANSFYKSSLYMNDVFAVLDHEDIIESQRTNGVPFAPIQNITFENVSFRYTQETSWILNQISFKANIGERIALVGYNGAGKSTLSKLLLRLYDPQEGSIFINDIPLSTINPHHFRQHTMIVFQDFQIYPVTIAENILLRQIMTQKDRELVTTAIHLAGLDDLISTLPSGINTVLTREYSNAGIVLSGGQRQRLAAARIFAHPECQLVIIDEISSALDPIAVNELNKNIIDFCRDKILFMISHQLSTTMDADQIYYIESGMIREHGTHNELMKIKGSYADMFVAQSKNYKRLM